DAVEYRLDDHLTVFSRQLCQLRDFVDQISFCHTLLCPPDSIATMASPEPVNLYNLLKFQGFCASSFSPSHLGCLMPGIRVPTIPEAPKPPTSTNSRTRCAGPAAFPGWAAIQRCRRTANLAASSGPFRDEPEPAFR